MKIYLLTHGDIGANTMKVNVFFFKRSAMAAAKRIQAECGEWEARGDCRDRIAYWETRTGSRWMSVSAHYLLFRDWSLRRWIHNHAHWQNLNEDRNGKIKGSILKNGRAWFHPFGYGHKRRSLEFSCQWVLWSKNWSLQGDVGSGDANNGVSFNFGCGLFSFYFTVEGVLPRRFIEWGRQRALKTSWLGYEYMAWPRSTGIRFFEKTIWFEIWNWDAGWDRRQPKWMSFNFSPADFLLGEHKHTSKNLLPESKVETIVLPDGIYPVEVMLTEDRWKRPRWPWPTVVRRAQIDCPGGIPKPGKGENSYDCGEDATFGLTCPASTVDEALEHLKASVMRDRERYGGKNWKPSEVSA